MKTKTKKPRSEKFDPIPPATRKLIHETARDARELIGVLSPRALLWGWTKLARICVSSSRACEHAAEFYAKQPAQPRRRPGKGLGYSKALKAEAINFRGFGALCILQAEAALIVLENTEKAK